MSIMATRARRPCLADLMRNISYEVTPLRGTEKAVLAHVPTGVPLTVTVTEARGLDATIGFAERLLRHGYAVAPHLPARLFVAMNQVEDVAGRLREAGARSVFVIAGDMPRPAGPFADAFSLLQAIHALGNPFDDVGIAGYPEGHASIPQEAIDLALKQKAPLATYIITQICFRAGTTAAWAARIAAAGVDIPVRVGIPGPVNRQKLVRISARLGLGQSARFLRNQHHLLWRILLPGAYRPSRLARRLDATVPQVASNIRGLHIFTFNELRGTERWRRRMLAELSEQDGEPTTW
jgi:methylenetetrahydrofolate reductase (NADPH)